MHTPATWLALVMGIIALLFGIGGTVTVKSGKIAISGLFGAVLILVAFLLL